MSDLPDVHPVEDSVRRWLGDLRDFARREPAKALGVACGTGLLLNLVPAGVIVRTAVTAAVALGRPALLGLGVVKVVEFALSRTSQEAAQA